MSGPGPAPLRVLIVEDEVLLAIELEHILAEAGHEAAGHAMDSGEAVALAREVSPDLALVDVHLLDGPTGVEVARALSRMGVGAVLFMTANAKRIPEDYAGAAGVIAKPYSPHGVTAAVRFLARLLGGERDPGPPPRGVVIAPAFARRWGIAPAG